MGYYTDFEGELTFKKVLAPQHLVYLMSFTSCLHVHWDSNIVQFEADPYREFVGLPLGENACYFTGRDQFLDHYNYPYQLNRPRSPDDPAYIGPKCPGKPYYRCPWDVTLRSTLCITVDKPYYYIEWLEYLLDHFIIPWGYVLQGEMKWKGQDEDDIGVIAIENNIISLLEPFDPERD